MNSVVDLCTRKARAASELAIQLNADSRQLSECPLRMLMRISGIPTRATSSWRAGLLYKKLHICIIGCTNIAIKMS